MDDLPRQVCSWSVLSSHRVAQPLHELLLQGVGLRQIELGVLMLVHLGLPAVAGRSCLYCGLSRLPLRWQGAPVLHTAGGLCREACAPWGGSEQFTAAANLGRGTCQGLRWLAAGRVAGSSRELSDHSWAQVSHHSWAQLSTECSTGCSLITSIAAWQ